MKKRGEDAGACAGLKVKIAGRITDFPVEDWDAVFPAGPENYYFFKTLDESDFPQFRFYYILVYEANVPVGATTCFFMDFPMDAAATGYFKKITNCIRRVAPRMISAKVIMCGLPMGQGKIGIAGEPAQVIKAICGAMRKIAKDEDAATIAFKDFPDSYKNILDELFDEGFFKMQSLPATGMEIRWTSFDHYLSSLSSVSRSGIKRKLKKIDGNAKIDLEISRHPDEPALKEIHGLYLQTCLRQEVGFEDIPLDFFRNIPKNMPQGAKFFLWKMNGKIVSFAFCLVSDTVFVDYYLGFDYTLAHENNLYFVRFRDMMKWCIEKKIKRYEMGQTGYEPKRRLGFEIIPLYIYIRHRNRFINFIFRFLGRIFQPENFHPIFKEMKKPQSSDV